MREPCQVDAIDIHRPVVLNIIVHFTDKTLIVCAACAPVASVFGLFVGAVFIDAIVIGVITAGGTIWSIAVVGVDVVERGGPTFPAVLAHRKTIRKHSDVPELIDAVEHARCGLLES